MDETQMLIKNKLGLNEMQIEAFKAIYDFVSRFAGVCQASWNQKISLHSDWDLMIEAKHGDIINVPKKTRHIITTIGTRNLSQYFSPQAYSRKFEGFCRKLMEDAPVIYADYVVQGLITFKEAEKKAYEVVETYYEEDGLFAGSEA